MRFQALLTAVAASTLAAVPGASSVLVYEPFAYDPGLVLENGLPATGVNLSGGYTAPVGPFQQLVAASPGLTYGSLAGTPLPEANRLSQTNGVVAGSATVAVDADVVVAEDAAIYWSALMTLDDSTNGNRFAHITFTDTTTGDFIGFGEPVVGSGAIRVSAQTAGTGGAFVANGPDNAFVDGNTVLLVGRYLNAAAADGDRLDLLVYDTTHAETIASAFDLLDSAAELAISLTGRSLDLLRIDSITFAIRGTNNNYIDELRIGTTYADVVPEPGTALLFASGLAGLLAARKRGVTRASERARRAGPARGRPARSC